MITKHRAGQFSPALTLVYFLLISISIIYYIHGKEAVVDMRKAHLILDLLILLTLLGILVVGLKFFLELTAPY